MSMQRLRSREVALAIAVILLAFLSVGYGVIQTNAQKDAVSCNRSIIIQTNDALRQRDDSTIKQATSSKTADEARRKVILLLVNRVLRGEGSINQQDLDRLLAEYNEAVDRRARDLDATIERARSAPVPAYACLNGQAIAG